MHPIHWVDATDGKTRPAVILTRENMVPHVNNLTVAPITSTPRTSRTQVPVGPENGLARESFVNCDDIQTIPRRQVLDRIGQLTIEQEGRLTGAIHAALRLL